jgi:hypothetical protein
MPVDVLANNASTYLNAAVTTTPAPGTVETWTFVATASFPQIGTGGTQQFRMAIGPTTDTNPEIVLITQVNSATTATVTRGIEGSPVKTHQVGDPAVLVFTAAGLDSRYPAKDASGNLAIPGFITASSASSSTPGLHFSAAYGGAASYGGNAGIGLDNPAAGLRIVLNSGGAGVATAVSGAISNVLDDGNGNMTPAGLLNLSGTAGTAPTTGAAATGDKLVLYATTAGNGYGFGIQASTLVAYTGSNFDVRAPATSGQQSNGPVGVRLTTTGQIVTYTSGGAARNTLDDGNGYLTAVNTIQASNGVFNGGGNQVLLRPAGGTNQGAFYLSNNGVAYIYSNAGSVRQTLDDGSGNMTLGGVLKPQTGRYTGLGVSFASGWSNYGSGGYSNVQYYLDGLGRVVLWGVATGPTIAASSSSLMCTLPVGYRPAANEMFPIFSNNGVPCVVWLKTDGTVTVVNENPAGNSAVTGWFTFSGISFQQGN